MIVVTIEKNIQRQAQEVFDYIANPENNPEWQGGMKKCTIVSPGDLGVGTIYEQEAEFMSKPILTTFKITQFEAGHLIKGESIESTFPITFTRMVQSGQHGCHVKAIVTGDPKGVMGWFPFLTRWMIKRSIGRDYRVLKQLLES